MVLEYFLLKVNIRDITPLKKIASGMDCTSANTDYFIVLIFVLV